ERPAAGAEREAERQRPADGLHTQHAEVDEEAEQVSGCVMAAPGRNGAYGEGEREDPQQEEIAGRPHQVVAGHLDPGIHAQVLSVSKLVSGAGARTPAAACTTICCRDSGVRSSPDERACSRSSGDSGPTMTTDAWEPSRRRSHTGRPPASA